MGNKTFQSVWESYRKNCIPPNVPSQQLEILERTFFGGAWGLFCLFSAGPSEAEFTAIENELHARFLKAAMEAAEEIASHAKTKAPN